MNNKEILNILIIEAYTDANVGSCALVENAIKLLRERFPGSTIKVMAHVPKVFHDLYGIETIKDIFEYPFLQARLKQIFWLLKTSFWMTVCMTAVSVLPQSSIDRGKVPFARKLAAFIDADLVISVGAERINDKFFKNVVFSLYTFSLVRKLGKKMVIFPSTIGPFIFGWSKRLARPVLKSVDLIYTRDEESTKATRVLTGDDATNLVETIDMAVLQEWIPREEALQIIGADENDSIVGISAMRWSYFRNRIETEFSNYESYLDEMALLADSLISEYGVRIVLYPTNYPVHGCREDDLATSLEIRSRMKLAKEVLVIEQLPTPAVLKGMLACSDLNITTRMHACILSTGACVPTISVNYLFKVREYMRSLGLEEFSVDIEEFTAEWTLGAFDRMWLERQRWKDHLSNVIEEKKSHVRQSMERLDDLVR